MATRFRQELKILTVGCSNRASTCRTGADFNPKLTWGEFNLIRSPCNFVFRGCSCDFIRTSYKVNMFVFVHLKYLILRAYSKIDSYVIPYSD